MHVKYASLSYTALARPHQNCGLHSGDCNQPGTNTEYPLLRRVAGRGRGGLGGGGSGDVELHVDPLSDFFFGVVIKPWVCGTSMIQKVPAA